jgi:hypothetical protein
MGETGGRKRYHPVDAGDRQWHALLAFALERADGFECALPYPVTLQDMAAWPLWPRALGRFRADVVDRHVSLFRWEELQRFPTQFVRFRLSPGLAGWIESPRCLDHWCWRYDMPEDPTFYCGHEVLLATESRHGRIAVYADPFDVAVLAGSGIRLLEPLGVRAEPWPTP